MPSTKRKGLLHILSGSRKDRHNNSNNEVNDGKQKQLGLPPTSPQPRHQQQQVNVIGAEDRKQMSSNGPVYDQRTGLYTFPKKTVAKEKSSHEYNQTSKKNMENGDMKNTNHRTLTQDLQNCLIESSNDAGFESNLQNRINGASSTAFDENRTLRFVGRRGLATGDGEDITSKKGTVRGVQNRVRAGIANFEFKPLDTTKKKYYEEEKGSIIVYTTSTTIVRQTFDNCVKVKKLFGNHRVVYEERDLFLNPNHQRELSGRIGEEESSNLPIIFIDGQLIGNIQQLEELNESGELSNILTRFEKRLNFEMCQCCGDRKYINCVVCNGSKKSVLRNDFTDQFRTLRCSQCDENGLQKCPECYSKS